MSEQSHGRDGKNLPSIKEGFNFLELISKYAPHIERRISSYRFDPATAKDVKQEILISFWEALENNKVRHPSAYLYSIVNNTCNKFIKNSSKVKFVDLDSCSNVFNAREELLFDLKEYNEEVFDKIISIINIHLDDLTGDLIKKRYLDGMSYEELSDFSGKSQGAVRKRVSRGIKTIQTLI